MEHFDISIHSIEEVPGKHIVINDVTYSFQNEIAEGGEAIIFPLRNVKSGISKFVCKLYKYKSTHESYQEIVANIKGFSSFKLNAISDNEIALHTEVYEINGALFRLQDFLGYLDSEEDQYHSDLMNEANKYFKESKYLEAIHIYEKVLSKNNNHTDALINISGCYASTGKLDEALNAINQSISIDKNIRENYLQLSQIYLSYQYPEFAIGTLERGLKRWPFDTKIIKKAVDLALKYDFVDYALQKLQFVAAELKLPLERYISTQQGLRERLNESSNRVERYNKLIQKSSGLQQKGNFLQASDLLQKAISTSKNNLSALFNYNLCEYHLANNKLTEQFLLVYHRSQDETLRNYTLLLILLSAFRDKDFELSYNIANILSTVENIYDLPRMPSCYYEYGIESTDIKEIVDTLKFLRAMCSEKNNIDDLISKYQQL